MSDHAPQQPTNPASQFEDDDEGTSSIFFHIGGFLFCTAVAIFLLIGTNWEDQIASHTTGRRSGVAQLINDFGQMPTIGVLGALALLFAVLAVRAWRRDRAEGA